MHQRAEWIGLICGRLGRVAPALPMHMIEVFRLGIVWREHIVADRPCRADAARVPDFTKICFAQAKQRRAEHLGIATDPVVNHRVERLTFVVYRLLRVIAFFLVNGVCLPVFALATEIIAAFQKKNLLASGGKSIGHCAAACSRTDDDDVILAHDFLLWSGYVIILSTPRFWQRDRLGRAPERLFRHLATSQYQLKSLRHQQPETSCRQPVHLAQASSPASTR